MVEKSLKLIADVDQIKSNISKVYNKISSQNIGFRPHFKTHQSRMMGKFFKDFDIDKITVSSIPMAEYFSDQFKDITIAFPLDINEIEKLNSIDRTVTLNLLIVDPLQIEFLKTIKRDINIFIEIDCGYGRSGVIAKNFDMIEKLINGIEGIQNLYFKGFLTHSGNSYGAKSKFEIESIYYHDLELMKSLKERFKSSKPIISMGDTPSTSIVKDFGEVDELRPGNFIFYDFMQVELGATKYSNIGVYLKSSVVQTKKDSFVISAGAVDLSKEFIISSNKISYGKIFDSNDREKIVGNIYSLSQEHGLVEVVDKNWFKGIKIGDFVNIYPIHSCLTADCLGKYYGSDEKIYDHFKLKG
ncbi:MAG: hypothetical protein CR982_06965 [Candidatus Cloacimonadota bacterium]|nr:MAG: hypothetical protein CR982_06965 [Candidatus Cloacimonadota bacterium]PIE80661.1 MAG: hypothetical protein CSA15_01800 [Candidatus Delongbacteria bacterium]